MPETDTQHENTAQTQPASYVSDRARNAQKYDQLVKALRRATATIHGIEKGANIDIDRVLRNLLPVFLEATGAEHGFIARQSLRADKDVPFEFLASHPKPLPLNHLQSSELMHELVAEEGARLIPERSDGDAIPELQEVHAHSAVLASVHTLEHAYILGLCDKTKSDEFPFLTPDRIVLENLLSLLGVGLRTATRQQREHKAIQQISESVASGIHEEVWQIIAQQAAHLANGSYAVLYSMDIDNRQLVPRCAWESSTEGTVGTNVPLRLDGSNSLNAYVAENLTEYYVPDITQSSIPFLKTDVEDEVRSAYSVPLLSQGKLVGTLYVANTAVDGIKAAEREVIRRLAPHAAIALHNAQLMESNRRALELDEAVIDVHQAIADILEEQSAERIGNVLQQHFPKQSDFFIATYNGKTGQISLPVVYEQGHMVANTSEHPNYHPRKHGERRGVLDYMLDNKNPVLRIDDFATWADREQIEHEYRDDVRCCLFVTLKHGDEIVGWTGFRGYAAKEMFSAQHEELLVKTAPHIAIVLQNVYEYEQRLQELRVVSDFQARISNLSATEAQELNTIAHEVELALKRLGLHTGDMFIALYDQASFTIHMPKVYLGEHELSVQERESHPIYRTRQIDERNGCTEWILEHGQHLLMRTLEERVKLQRMGIVDLPQRSHSWLGVPMKVGGKIMGVMALRSLTHEITFADEHVPLVQTIANQAAIAIENARLYQHSLDEAKRQAALYRASEAIAGAGLMRDAILRTIVQQAAQVTGCFLGSVYLVEPDRLTLAAAWPPSVYDQLKTDEAVIRFDSPGVITRAIHEDRDQIVSDATNDPDFTDVTGGKARSELVVLLRRGGLADGEVIGVLNVEHAETGKLTESDHELLQSLANLAVVTVQNAEQAQALSRTKSVALMGAWGAEIVHDVNREVGNIRREIGILEDLAPASIKERLKQIDDYAERMILPALPNQAQSASIMDHAQRTPILDRIIADELKRIRAQHTRRSQYFTVVDELTCNDTRVAIHEQWLRRLLRHYVRNAEKHLPKKKGSQIRVQTRINEQKAVVSVEDNGTGVRPEIRPLLFESPVDHDNEPPGQGLMLVGFICEEHSGRAWLDWSEPGQGSRFVFEIPLAGAP